MQKTLVVAVERRKRHPLYNKTVRLTTRYKVHDGNKLAKTGDIVRIVESRPLSREKRWRLAEIVTRREVAEIAPREIDASLLGIERPHTERAMTQEAPAPAQTPATEETVETPVAEEAETPAVAEEAPAAQSEAEPEVAAAEVEAEATEQAEQAEE